MMVDFRLSAKVFIHFAFCILHFALCINLLAFSLTVCYNPLIQNGDLRMTKKDRALKIIEALKAVYPEAQCALAATEPWRLLIAVRLSAQCTDKRVNLVTPALFARFPTIESMAGADEDEIAQYIKSCGLYKTKAHDIKEMCRDIIDRFGGIVPDSIEALTTLPGVGRKTANLIVGDVYKQPAVVVDTHFIRLSNRMGLTKSKDPVVIEREMRALLPADESNDFCHRIVQFGRDCCTARNPNCENCPIAAFCASAKQL